MSKPLPTQSRIVVIGGGAVGASIAYHLTRAGERDVVLLEKTQLTDGATWHAAGLVGQFRTHQNLTRLMQDSVRLFETLGQETGQETGWKQVGSLRIAASQDRWMEFQRAPASACGDAKCSNLRASVRPTGSSEVLFGPRLSAVQPYAPVSIRA